MKLKNNEIAVFEEMFTVYDGKESGEKLYFNRNSDDLKNLKINSKNLSYWNGNNWVKKEIQFVEILKYDEEIEYDEHGNPAYSYQCKYRIGDDFLTVSQSNCSGHLTPFYTGEM